MNHVVVHIVVHAQTNIGGKTQSQKYLACFKSGQYIYHQPVAVNQIYKLH